ncbi:MAG: RIP metalloprotease RseP [Ascidiaceihabitans sp.]|nr:RIP metalloprotease RseP [Ascidiaceihabitans sp.]
MDIGTLVGQFGGFFWVILAFIVALSVIVAIHEYGHYIVGRWSGIHADVFSIGFGPVIWSRKDKRGTQWQIALLPLGGYVKFAGDANEASGKDEEAMEEVAADPEALRKTMHGAPLWARALTVAAGPVFNFAFSALLFFGVVMWSGTPSDPLTVSKLRPLPDVQSGLQPGDRILRVEGQEVPSFIGNDVLKFANALPRQVELAYEVQRDGETVSTVGPFLAPARVGGVTPRSAAQVAGLKEGDVITHVDGTRIYAFGDLARVVESSDGRGIPLIVWSDGVSRDITLTPKRVDEPQDEGGFVTYWRIGVASSMAFEPAYESVGVWDALSGSVSQVGRIITGSITGLGSMIAGQISTCNLSGPIGIAQTSGAMASQGVDSFIWFIAVLSTAVGLLNLFPIPALDGGHLVFYAFESVTGRPPSDRALRILMTIGLTLVLGLMMFSLFNDLFCP